MDDASLQQRYSLSDFLTQHAQQDRGGGFFELEHARLLEVNLTPNSGDVWTKTGSMVAYHGAVHFEREGVLEHGLGKFLKKSLTGEGTRLTKATGNGKVYLADAGKKVTLLSLSGEEVFINGNDVLAFQPTLTWDINLMRRIGAMLGGGLFNMKFQGKGLVALTTHYDPLVLRVEPGKPVFTDPNATVAWGGVSVDFKTDIQLKTFFGRGSGESIQMRFDATANGGFVVVQPYEEIMLAQKSRGGGS